MAKRALLVLGLVLTVGVLAILPDKVEAATIHGRFIDDDGHPLENGIEAIAAKGITQGCNPPANDMYCPDRTVTRAEAAAFIARALGLPASPVDYFTDDNGHVNEPAINRIAHARITFGCNPPASTRYCPDRKLTRGEFSAFVARAFDLPDTSVDYFTDDNGHILETAINKMAEARITIGCNPPANTLFCPNNTLTRAHTAAFLKRGLGLPVPGIELRLSNWGPISCSKDGEHCNVDVTLGKGTNFRVDEGWFQTLPYQNGEEAEFIGESTSFALRLDGEPVTASELALATTPTTATRMWTKTLSFSAGSHTLVGEWRWRGTLIQRTTAHIVATG